MAVGSGMVRPLHEHGESSPGHALDDFPPGGDCTNSVRTTQLGPRVDDTENRSSSRTFVLWVDPMLLPKLVPKRHLCPPMVTDSDNAKRPHLNVSLT